jgi:diguanylate cyclase (GGDEF)-like protein/PAS domain S-box-containing protein
MRLRDHAEETGFGRYLLGACLGLAGVLMVEALLRTGLRPLTPIAWPLLGALAGAALGGAPGFAGGSLILVAYYLVNLLQPQRFPEFYAHPYNTISWLAGLAGTGLLILALRGRRNAAEALRVSEMRLRTITDHLPALVAYIDAQERYRFANRTYEDWLRMPRDALLGRSVRELWGLERYAAFKPNIERALRGERVSHEYALVQEGVERRVMATYVPHIDASGVRGFFVLGSDITQLAAARNELHAQHQRLEAALDGSSLSLWDTDLRTGRVYLSEAWADIVGGQRNDRVSTVEELVALLHPDDVEPLRRVSLEVMKGARASYTIEHRVRSAAGDWRWILSRGRVTERDPASGRALRMIGTNLDITDRRRMEEALQSVAQSDPLTGLANRLLFQDRLRQALARARRAGSSVALLYLDLDRFKEVNDSLGHGAGDILLKDFAARLRAGVRATDTVARFGGDEFVILLEDVKDRGQAIRVAEKIVAEARQPLMVEGRELVATASIGVAFGEGNAVPEELLRRADAALYDAKNAGRDRYRIAA